MKILDCAGWNVSCSPAYYTVEANPDIAGIGVIVGFLATTCLAFLIAFSVLFLDRYEKIVTLYRRYFTSNKEEYCSDPDGDYWRSPAFWSKVLSKNLLAFSDTQLLTGLAIQFTALLKHCELAVYHFQIVTELAFLTTVTHLLTVVALRNYFVKNKWINLPRIFFMLGNLGLLGYTSFVSYSYDKANLNVSMSLACFFQGDRPEFTHAFGGKWAALLIGAIGGHVTVILAMYFWKEEEESEERSGWTWTRTCKWVGALFRTWFIAPVYGIYGIIMAGQGLAKTQALGKATVDIQGSERRWGFGQFLPVLLLALPLFAGWESFWEEKDEDRDNRFGRHSRFSRGGGTTSQINMHEMNNVAANNGSRRPSPSDMAREEMETESTGPSPLHTPLHTPRLRSTSRVSIDGELGPPPVVTLLEVPNVPLSGTITENKMNSEQSVGSRSRSRSASSSKGC